MCWMIKLEAPEYKKPKEELRAYSKLAATKGKGHGLGPPGIAAFTDLLQALSEREAAQWERPARLEWQTSSKRETIWNRRGFRFGTSLQAGQSVRVELVISVAQHREHICGALGQTGAKRLLGQASSGALERALSTAIEQN